MSQPKSYAARNAPVELNLNMCPRAKLYRLYAPYRTLPSGATVGVDDDWSMTLPPGSVFVAGSTPACAPAMHPPGVPLGGMTLNCVPSLQPSERWPRSEAAHLGVRFGFTAMT